MKKISKYQSIINIVPIILITAVLPLIMYLYSYDNQLSSYPWMAENGDSIDLFLYGKMVFFQGVIILSVVIFLYNVYQQRIKERFPVAFYLLLAYALLSVASTIVSEYRSFGFSGIYEQFESLWCLIGYVCIIIYIYYMVRERRQIDILVHVLLVSSLIMGIIGTGQFFGFDFITTDLAKMLYTLGGYETLDLALTFGKGIVYITLYNPDYVGLYTTLICPVMAVLVLHHKKKLIRVLSLISIALLTLSTIGAQVASGYIGLAVTAIMFLAFLLRQIIGSGKKLVLTGITALVAVLFVIAVIQTNNWLNIYRQSTDVSTLAEPDNMQDIYPDEPEDLPESDLAEETVSETSESDITSGPNESYPLERITETDDYVEFCYNGIIFRESMRFENAMVYLDFVDENNEPIDYDYDELTMTYTLTEEGLEGISSISANLIDKYIGFITTINGKSWAFTLANKDDVISYYTFNSLGHLDKNIDSESAIFTGHYSLFNGRGYIWAKTIPLLKKYMLLGSGADSFTLVFPQSDYLDAYKGGYENLIISKPHCIYLQIAVQTGLLSLILLLAFYVWYAIKCLKLYFWRKELTFEQTLAAAIFAGTAGFLVISLVNDSTICVTPVFAAILGIGIALNTLNERERN